MSNVELIDLVELVARRTIEERDKGARRLDA
jgi:hypothetical protein